MINSVKVVSRYFSNPPASVSADRRIKTAAALYPLQEVLDLARSNKLVLWSKGAIDDAQKWGFDVEGVCLLLVSGLPNGRYIGSEWCLGGQNGSWAACDAYALTSFSWCERQGKNVRKDDYVKFAITTAGIIISASNHPEGA